MNNAAALALVFVAACGPLPEETARPDEEGDAAVIDSPFAARRRPRLILQNQSSAQTSIEVGTKDELLAALTSLPSTGSDASYGRSIIIRTDRLPLTQTVALASQHAGLTIRSSSRTVVSLPTGGLIFDVPSGVDDVSVYGLIVDTSGGGTVLMSGAANRIAIDHIGQTGAGSLTVLTIPDGAVVAQAMLTNNVASSASLLSFGGTGLLSNSSLSNNVSNSIAGGNFNNVNLNANSFAGLVQVVSDGSIFAGNRLQGGLTITSGNNNAVTGNYLSGTDINTSGASLNSIVGNVGVGTISAGSGDAVTSNTGI